MILRWTNRTPRPVIRWRGKTATTLAQVQAGGTTAVAAIIGPAGADGTPDIVIDDSAQNIITTGPNGLSATPMWQTTDW